MNGLQRIVIGAVCGLVALGWAADAAKADGINSSSGLTDTVAWSQLGGDGDTVNSPFMATSANGVTVTGTFSGDGSIFKLDSDLTLFVRADSVTLAFNSPVSAAGAQLDANFFGLFTGTISAYDGGTLLGSYTEDGDSEDMGGTRPFVGWQSNSADITSIVFSVNAGAPQGFFTNTLYLSDTGGSGSVPEPDSMALIGIGFAVLAFVATRKKILTLTSARAN